MEPNEITALNRCVQDIKYSVVVSSQVLQKLEYREIISKTEKQTLMQLRNGCDRNLKLVEIMKKKVGGFQAFTEALLQEKISNEHFVNKMRNNFKNLNCKRVVPEDTKRANYMRHLEQTVKEYDHFFGKLSSLVLGHGATTDEETINMKDAVINELEQTRQILNMREHGLHRAVSAFENKFEREKTDLAQLSKEREDYLEKSLDELNEKFAIMQEEMRMVQKHHDEIIRDLVEAEVKKRLMTIDQNIHVSEYSPCSLKPETLESDNDPDGRQRTDLSISTSAETAGTQQLCNGQHIHFRNVQINTECTNQSRWQKLFCNKVRQK